MKEEEKEVGKGKQPLLVTVVFRWLLTQPEGKRW